MYAWETPIGFADDERVMVQTPAGVGVVHRRHGDTRFWAKFRGVTIGRNYTSMENAKRIVEMVAARHMREAAEEVTDERQSA
jgi:hypothetical protein